VYFFGTMIIAIVTYFVHACMKARADMDAVYAQRTAILRPVLYTLSASLAGGSQVITHSKGLSSLLTLAFQGDVVGVFTDWPIYVELFITVAAGILWVQRSVDHSAVADWELYRDRRHLGRHLLRRVRLRR
jgi:hypothetical protein